MPAPDHAGRLERLRDGIRDADLDGLLVTHLPNIRYVAGFSGSSGLLLVLVDGGAWLLTDFRYEEQAIDELPPAIGLHVVRDGRFSALADLLESAGPRRLGFEARYLSVEDRKEIGERCGPVDWEPAPSLLQSMRARKDQEEIRTIEEAARVAEEALRQLLPVVEEGMAEREVAAELAYRLRLAGSGPLPFEVIAAAGAGSARPHARAGERVLRESHLLLFDFGASVRGYCCDLTRTVVLGSARDWQREIHEAVREAQEAAIVTLEPGRSGEEVDRAARELLEDRGWGDRFGHSTGHGIGLEVHEGPRLSRRSDDVLEVGNVVTVEPGVYLSGRGGVRIEDDVVVDVDGPRRLTRFSRDLLEL